MENQATQKGERGDKVCLLWLDPATGRIVHECPAPASQDPAGDTRLEFLYHYSRDAEDVPAEMIEQEEKQ